MDSALAWLLAWTANNIGVTLLNKAAFSKVDFPYPFFLSFVHMCCNSVGAAMVFRRMDSERAKAKDSDEGAGDLSTKTSTTEVFDLAALARLELL